ncbi:BrnT family toxin [Methylobacterium nodulans]|uniref:BrnT family toxin n=1 Tax=Methylobacterium nodulans (strain LMG 21967 / CNCM I-2342 / ORS 2060) TaxID=460265 RepID=B8IBQ4_METNO|nr:BrnT family toxin [Methylobacterium nodulans]ACL59308.1 protein of unknown function DUF497 [Methylobacterium nodulans ORS 2060]
MDLDWHPAKSDKNLAERGFGFDCAALVFLGPVLAKVDGRADCGEVRVNALGEIDGVVYHVTYTDREEVRWIISARRADRKERRLWLAFLSNS